MAIGKSEEKAEVCARIGWSGVGINLNTHRPTPTQIGSAARRGLNESHYHIQARRIQQDIARYDAGSTAAALLERLAATRRPVLRGTEPAWWMR